MFHLQGEKGFTVLEILAVLVIVGVLSAVVVIVINYGFLSGLKVYTVSHQIAADMRFAQRLSITDYKSYTVKFATPFPFHSYNIYQSDSGNSVKNSEIPKGINCTGDDSFVFLSDGSANFLGTGIIRIDDAKVKRFLTVTRATGKVKIGEESVF